MSVVSLLILSIIPYSSGIEVASAFKKTTGNNSLALEQFQQVQLGWTRDRMTQYASSAGKVIPTHSNISDTILVQYQRSSSYIVAML
ncbi:unnamed protein product [Rotaria sp. Silwood2]|nr:unnamed protein product [Rotaria sp. Silwood2]CAF3385862.1 unnamed protein product [Rotaria sp. Silwood2]CAF4382565.1 unnamed protein product [Rotaria sp. Silwood2]CAF4384475.1 unnamed protein product [Rotaria sp. Silwood2]